MAKYKTTKEKRERWTMRMSKTELEIIQQASDIETRGNASEFVRDAAIAEAKKVIAFNKKLSEF